jgi:4-amino-4-deoxy-L-arabinose transferase-like glycosyltransferase
MNRFPFASAAPRPTLLAAQPALRVFLLALIWLGALAWLRPLFLPDEGRYVGVAWEMLRSGNWVTPTLDGLPFFHKPPLFYWITAVALELFGPNEWAARSAPILAGSATVTVLYVVMRDWLGERDARWAALVLATQPLFFAGAQFANLDTLVAGCIAVAILLGARAALRLEAGDLRRGDLLGAYVAAALGVLAKGLIGLVLPALVLFIWLASIGHWRTIVRLCWGPGILLFLLVVAPWFAAVQWVYPGFLHYFFVVQQFQRFASTGFNNVQPIWFYVPVLFALVLPWSAWLLLNLRRSRLARASTPAVLPLMGSWLAVVLVFFSIPQSKLIGYILPTLPPVAVFIALSAAPLLETSRGARRLWWASAAIAVSICVGAVIAFSLVHPKSSRELALQLAAHRGPHDGLAFLDEYHYDVPFYLRDASPVVLVSNWDPAEVQRHDNWRKEVADAGTFAPSLAADRLLDPAQFRSALCSGRVRWVMAAAERVGQYPFLAAAPVVATEGERKLWHTDASIPAFNAALGCAAPS